MTSKIKISPYINMSKQRIITKLTYGAKRKLRNLFGNDTQAQADIYNAQLLNSRQEKKQTKQEQKHKKIWVSATITATFKRTDDKPYVVETQFMFETTRKNKKADYKLNKEMNETEIEKKYKNGQSVTVEYTESKMTTIKHNKQGDKKQKMKDIVPLDGYGDQPWNTKNGNCVVDYLRHTYTDKSGFKNSKGKYLLSDEFFAKLHTYMKTADINETPDVEIIKQIEPDAYDGSFTMESIYVWCKMVNIPHYGLDTNECLIMELKFTRDQTKKAGKTLKPMVYQYKNNHFNPTINPKKVLSLSKIGNGGGSVAKIQSEKKTYEMEYLPDMMNELPYIIEKYGRDLKNNNIRLTENERGAIVLSSVVIEEKNKRISNVNQDMELYRDFCERYEMKFEPKSFTTIGLEAIGDIDKSNMNPQTYDFFNSRGVCNRTHHGFVGDNTSTDDTQCFDINKHYSNCLSKPSDDFGLIDFRDDFIEYDNSDIIIGYYYVETYDMTLLHGNNIYSHNIVKYALSEGLIEKDDIKLMLHSKSFIPKNHFQDFVSDTYDMYGRVIAKKIINRTIGSFNTTERTNFKNVGFTNSVDELLSRINIHKRPFCKEFDVNEQKYYLYGSRESFVSTSNHRPLWISILDEGNMNLYKTAKSIGGEVVFRKTDALVIRNPVNVKTSDRMGCYDTESAPNTTYSNGELIVETIRHIKYPNHILNILKYKSSNEVNEIIEFCRNSGVLISGRAGTGKTYVGKKIIEAFDIKVRLSFTNKACININGSTIDKFIKLKDNKVCSSWASRLKMDYVIVDEISMLNNYYWGLLCDLKRITGAKFILLGDYRQCPAIEDEDGFNNDTITDYQYKSAMYYLCDYNRINFDTFNPNARYDKDLWDYSEGVFDGVFDDKLNIKYTEDMLLDGTNICYLNKTRKSINYIVNNKMKTAESIFIPANEKDDATQDCHIYEGLKVILHKTIKEKEEKLFSKNETSHITKIENGMITIGDIYTFPEKEFQETCLLGYATTCYKAQGDTCDGIVNVYDFDIMNRNLQYTSITRATKLADIKIITGFKTKFKEANAVIYKMTCSETNRTYIGSTRNYENRQEQHLSPTNDCMSRELINPAFMIIMKFGSISNKELKKLEQRLIDSSLNCVNKQASCVKD